MLYNLFPLRNSVAPFLYLLHPTTGLRHLIRLRHPTSAALHTSHQASLENVVDFISSTVLAFTCTSTHFFFLENIVRSQMDSEGFSFGPYKIDPKEVFYATQFSYALVNLRPVVPGTLKTRLIRSS